MADFTCAMCGKTFKKARPDEEALAEARGIFGKIRPEECAVVCEDCYQLVNPENHPHLVEKAMKEVIEARSLDAGKAEE